MESDIGPDRFSGQLRRIKRTILKRYPKDKTPRYNLLEQAFKDAEHHHHGQVRKSGEPVIIHPYRVALLASDAGLDVEAVVIALLHDIIEDTEVTKTALKDQYGDWLAEVVDGLTKAGSSKPSGRLNSISLETYQKLLTSSIKDIRTLLVKIFDRLDNMRDLSHLSRAKQRRISTETMDVYVPMAQRMGLTHISEELTTLCFRFLYPKRFAQALEAVKNGVIREVSQVESIRKMVESSLTAHLGAPFRVIPLHRHVSEAIYQTTPVTRAFIGFRVVTSTPAHCYLAMGAIHTKCRTVPHSIRDYISNPKPNRYQGLESKVFIGGEPIQLEITWEEMDNISRWGILANWKGTPEELSTYYRNYLELLQSLKGDEDIRMEDVLRYGQMETLQVFTPKGDIRTFPQGSTVLDFAFAIHSDLGLACRGGRISHMMVGRGTELKDGDVVEVFRDPQVLADESWLNQVRTPRARIALRRALRVRVLQRAEEFGWQVFSQEIRRLGESPVEITGKTPFKAALKHKKLTLKQFYQQLGLRKLNLRPFLAEFGVVDREKLSRQQTRERSILNRYIASMFGGKSPEIKVKTHEDALVKMARCCQPLLGDPIVGVRREDRIVIHRAGCPQLKSVDPGGLFPVGWEAHDQKNPYTLTITALDKAGVIYKVGKVMHSLGVSILNMSIQRGDALSASILLDIEPVSDKTYQKIISRLRGIKEVKKIA
ncbi:MAG: HD domain-containing protein [Deltaproteobacteria bacterium]|nr:HD domain-containing protein [Deltaproteobacteria bacterium]